MSFRPYGFCGCWFTTSNGNQYLPQVELQSHTTILATTSRTVLKQTFINPLTKTIEEASYTFPLYDGVSVAGFRCIVADRTIVGIVKERNQARTEYREAIERGETAGLFQQNMNAADVFTTSIGNIPAGEKVLVEVTYLGELKNDAETDGARFTIPTNIAPRYGQGNYALARGPQTINTGGIKITVDVQLEKGVAVRRIQSPSHPIAITMGQLSTTAEDMDTFENHLAYSTLTLGTTELDKDFIIIVQAKGQDTPRALLETHPTLPHQRVLMTTLVPKFNIPNEHPEIVFVVDRSGSMYNKMHLVTEALKVFLKSLPVSVKFNICSFGSHYTFLFDKSRTYDAESLQIAINHVSSDFGANYGGTEMLQPIKAVLKQRYKDLPLEVMLLTDGEIWNQQELFDAVNAASQEKARFFTLGVGSDASSSLVEGVARAGNGFSQWVDDGERIDKRIVRMLKGALTPHIKYTLEVKYNQSDASDSEDFEIIESFEKSMDLISHSGSSTPESKQPSQAKKKIISLFSSTPRDETTSPPQGRYDHLPILATPHVLQTPHIIPELFPHSRSTIYLILGPESCQRIPSSVLLRGTAKDNDLELEIPVQDIGQGTTLHQLAAKKAMQELEEGRGWLSEAKTTKGKFLKSEHEGKWDLIVEREAVRLGTMFQVGGKFCSFVAVQDGKEDELPAYESTTQQSDANRKNEKKKKSGSFFKSQGKPLSFGSSQGFGSASGAVSSSFAAFTPQAIGQQQQQMRRSSPMMAPGGAATGFGSAPPPPPAPAGGLFGTLGRGEKANAKERSVQTTFVPGGASFGPGMGIDSVVQVQEAGASHFPLPKSAPSGEGLFGRSSTSLRARSSGGGLFGTTSNAPSFSFANASVGSTPSSNSFLGAPSSTIPPVQAPDTKSAPRRGMFALKKSYAAEMELAPAMSLATDEYEDEMDEGNDTAATSPPVMQSLSPLEKMQKLIDLQTFTGSWKTTDQFLALVSQSTVEPGVLVSVKSLIKHVMDAVEKEHMNVDGAEYGEDVCATIVAIAWLESVVEDEKDVWEMVVEKAKEWLEGQIDGSETVERIFEEVKKTWKK